MSWHAHRIKRGWAWIFLQKPEGQLRGECKLPTAEFFCSLTSEFDISLDKLRLSIASSDISSPLVQGRCPGSKPKHPVFQEGSTLLSEFQTHLGDRQTDLMSCGSIFVDTCSKHYVWGLRLCVCQPSGHVIYVYNCIKLHKIVYRKLMTSCTSESLCCCSMLLCFEGNCMSMLQMSCHKRQCSIMWHCSSSCVLEADEGAGAVPHKGFPGIRRCIQVEVWLSDVRGKAANLIQVVASDWSHIVGPPFWHVFPCLGLLEHAKKSIALNHL